MCRCSCRDTPIHLVEDEFDFVVIFDTFLFLIPAFSMILYRVKLSVFLFFLGKSIAMVSPEYQCGC